MDTILTHLEKQDSCTPATGLAMFVTILRMLLNKDYPNLLKRPLEKEYDFIVVGAGTAGCVVASRLSEDPKHTVLLLEAGGEEPEITRVPGIAENEALRNSSVEWDYYTEPHPEYCGGQPCYLPRAKMMGGSDSHNEMWYLVPNRGLHNEMTARGIKGWSYEEMLPYYQRRSEAYEIGKDGRKVDMSLENFPYKDENFNIVQQAYKEMGYSEPTNNGDFNQNYKTTSKKGERISSNRLYIEKLRFKRPNLHVATEAFVTKVIIYPETKTATGVEVYIREGDSAEEKVSIKARKEVIVSGGVIGSPQLLQLSGIGPKDVLEPLKIEVIKDLPVGRNFQNHPSFSGPTIKLTSTSTIPRDCDVLRKDIRNYVSNRSGPFAGTGVYISYLIFNSSHATKEYPDLMLALVPSITGFKLVDPGFSMCYYDTLSVRMMTTRVASRGSVSIISKNPKVHPNITLGFNLTQLYPLAEGFVWGHKLANCDTMQEHGMVAENKADPRCKHKEYGSYDYWMCAMKGHMQFWHHGMSSCSMGAKHDPIAVVDNRCRVHGIKGLRVIDASIIPVIPNVNVNSIVFAAAERCVDFLKEDCV